MDAMPFVAGALAWSPVFVVALLMILAGTIVFNIWFGKIDLSQLLSDSPGASLSRFQFLIFTFVIGFSYLMILCYEILHSGAASSAPHAATVANSAVARVDLPDASGAAWLLGISAGGYALGKGIQTSGDTAKANALVAANTVTNVAGGGTGAITATVNPATPGSGTVATTEPLPGPGSDQGV